MDVCELCGAKGNLNNAIVEGSIVSVCHNCRKFGNVIEIKKPDSFPIPTKIIKSSNKEPSETIDSNYAEKIRKARSMKGLTQKELARAIAEKESVIHKLESKQLKPPFKLAKKLEQFLRLTLIVKSKEETIPKRSFNLKNGELTIGDLVGLKKK